MAEVYRLMLQGLMARGWKAPRSAVQLSQLQLLWIMLRYAIV